MSQVLVDTSVLIKWFHSDGETELAEAGLLRAGHLSGALDALILDLALYEIGNVLTRALRWPPQDVADQLDDLLTICGTPLVSSAEWLRSAASLAHRHTLSFYDAAWAAAAHGLDVPLASSDRQLQAAGLAESPTSLVRRLRLS